MIGDLLLWARRNSRKAIAVAVAPGLLLLAVDAAIAHFAVSGEYGNELQYPPIIYGVLGFLITMVVVLPKARAPFAWAMRFLGVVGVLVGLGGTGLHVAELIELLEGDYSWANIQGTIGTAPPVFAPMAFTGIGALLFLLPSSLLYIRLNVGTPRLAPAPLVALKGDEQQDLNSRVG